MKSMKWCAAWMCSDHLSLPGNFSLQILEPGFLPLRKVWIYVITQNEYFGEPPDCAAFVTHTPNSSWMPSLPCFLVLIGQVNAKSVLLLSAIFHRFSKKYFIVHFFFFFVSPIQTMCVHSIPSYTWLWFGLAKWISLGFFLWLLIIQILFWHRVWEGCWIALEVHLMSDSEIKFQCWTFIYLCVIQVVLCSVSVGWAVLGYAGLWQWGNSRRRTASHGSLGADLCKLHYKLHSGLLCTVSQCKQQHHFPSYAMNQTELIWPMSESTPILCTPLKPF